MSLKDKGNAAFKSQKYKQAIKLYDEYVAQEHPDNKNAYFNMGLCYSKLKEHQKSIEACKSAIAIDPTYEKAYYRLMLEYYQVKNPYEVFINARLYVKHEKDQESMQVAEAKANMKIYKDYFVNKLSIYQLPKKLDEKDEIFELLEPLRPVLEKDENFNQQIDKYPNQWLEEWAQDIQSEDAKWEEIAYIIRQLDYSYGISLAYLYLNQITDPRLKKEVSERIISIKKEMKIENTMIDEYSQLEKSNENTSTQILSSVREEIRATVCQAPKIAQKKQDLQMDNRKNQQIESSLQIKATEKQKNVEKTNKIQELLQKKFQIKKNYEQTQESKDRVPPETFKQQKKQNKQTKTKSAQSEVKPAQPTEVRQQKIPSILVKQQQKTQEQIEALYKSYCGSLEKAKDLFVEVYRSTFSILNGRQSTTTMGKLLILIKKRVKKFKLVVAAFSDNEQKAIFDLLSKKNMEEYAVDFAPKYHKV